MCKIVDTVDVVACLWLKLPNDWCLSYLCINSVSSLLSLPLTHYVSPSLAVALTSLLPASAHHPPTGPSSPLSIASSLSIPFSVCTPHTLHPRCSQAKFYYAVRADWEGKCFMRLDLMLGRYTCVCAFCMWVYVQVFASVHMLNPSSQATTEGQPSGYNVWNKEDCAFTSRFSDLWPCLSSPFLYLSFPILYQYALRLYRLTTSAKTHFSLSLLSFLFHSLVVSQLTLVLPSCPQSYFCK